MNDVEKLEKLIQSHNLERHQPSSITPFVQFLLEKAKELYGLKTMNTEILAFLLENDTIGNKKILLDYAYHQENEMS